MLLADLGAEVIRIRRPGGMKWYTEPRFHVTVRGSCFLDLNLREPRMLESALHLVDKAGVLIEGYRPGVMERLGLGPDVCLERNPSLIYGRMTGWGQHGPLAQRAGHDLNYIGLSGCLHAMGQPGSPPPPPLNLIGDFGGGAMFLAVGVLAALLHARISGKGQVVDAAMSDGAAYLSATCYADYADGQETNKRKDYFLAGASHFYDSYACKDGKFIAVAAVEPQFYARLRELCGLQDPLFDGQWDKAKWPAQKERIAAVFRARTRDEWVALLGDDETCVSPVLDWEEAPAHPHNQARETFIMIDGVIQPAPAPRFSLTPSAMPRSADRSKDDTRELLHRWGVGQQHMEELLGKE
jgi:alpha-methylacyl-CoA racemase